MVEPDVEGWYALVERVRERRVRRLEIMRKDGRVIPRPEELRVNLRRDTLRERGAAHEKILDPSHEKAMLKMLDCGRVMRSSVPRHWTGRDGADPCPAVAALGIWGEA